MDNVLIIDDHKDVCDALQEVIIQEGFTVFIAYDGEEGISIFNSNNIDIVICDYQLPNQSGLEVMNKVLSDKPETAFILITGRGHQDIAIEALNKGALDYLKKPFDLKDLFIALGRYRERKHVVAKSKPIKAILVVDDDNIIRNRLAKELIKEKYHVFQAVDGKQGLEVFEKNKIDVVLTDLRMPKLEGIPFIKEIRKINDDQEIIILSGYGDEDDTIEALRCGAFAYLKKPFDFDELLLTVEKAVEKLTLKRSLLFRNRDYALTQELVGSFLQDKGPIIDLRNNILKQPAIDFAMQLIDSAIFCLVAFDKDFNIAFINKKCNSNNDNKISKTNDNQINDNWLSNLGFTNYSFTQFAKIANKVFEAENTIIEYDKPDQFLQILFTRLTVLTEKGRYTWGVALFQKE